jgi:hypothetical protein
MNPHDVLYSQRALNAKASLAVKYIALRGGLLAKSYDDLPPLPVWRQWLNMNRLRLGNALVSLGYWIGASARDY